MRLSGILMPIFSLSSDYGIGTFGKEAYEFADFLKKSGQGYWQLLPLNPTNYGDSPYQSFSSSAGNPYFIDLDMLHSEGLLLKSDYDRIDFGTDSSYIDYSKLYENRFPVLRKACHNFDFSDIEYIDFCDKNKDWLNEYSLFMALKNAHNGKSWHDWDDKYKFRDEKSLEDANIKLEKDIKFYKFIQYEFYKQWFALKNYVNSLGIKIIGDMPIYVADDSADVWANPEQFDLDENLLPKVVAGCPPDFFTEEGQLWGMPVYRWDMMEKEKSPYSWWRNRMKNAFKIYDIVRIDHFRGFESFYCIEFGSENAKNGVWRKGPGMKLFNILERDYGTKLPIIAEDLGFMTDEVVKLLKDSEFPGMKVLQFAFDGREDNDYLLHNHIDNCVVYTGTHDNDTVIGWTKNASEKEVQLARRYMHVDDAEGFNWAMIRTALMSVSDTSILMMQDIMGLGSEARINTPSTVGTNWQWRIGKGCVNDWLANIICENVKLYGRYPKIKE